MEKERERYEFPRVLRSRPWIQMSSSDRSNAASCPVGESGEISRRTEKQRVFNKRGWFELPVTSDCRSFISLWRWQMWVRKMEQRWPFVFRDKRTKSSKIFIVFHNIPHEDLCAFECGWTNWWCIFATLIEVYSSHAFSGQGTVGYVWSNTDLCRNVQHWLTLRKWLRYGISLNNWMLFIWILAKRLIKSTTSSWMKNWNENLDFRTAC